MYTVSKTTLDVACINLLDERNARIEREKEVFIKDYRAINRSLWPWGSPRFATRQQAETAWERKGPTVTPAGQRLRPEPSHKERAEATGRASAEAAWRIHKLAIAAHGPTIRITWEDFALVQNYIQTPTLRTRR